MCLLTIFLVHAVLIRKGGVFPTKTTILSDLVYSLVCAYYRITFLLHLLVFFTFLGGFFFLGEGCLIDKGLKNGNESYIRIIEKQRISLATDNNIGKGIKGTG